MPRERSLKAKAAMGSVWSIGGYGTGQFFRLLSNIVLAWLLFPEAFGLMALVAAVSVALEMFSDVGLQASVIQDPRGDDPAFLNNVFTLKIIRGLLLWSAAAALAMPMAMLYSQPRLAELIPVAALSCIFKGFRSVKFGWNQRHLRYARNTVVELSGQLSAILSMLFLAWLLRDVWALVYGGLVGPLVAMTLSHVILPGPRDRLAWHTPTILSLLNFGKWLFVSTVLTFFAKFLDRLLLGLLVPAGILGVYSVGRNLAEFPASIVDRIATSVLFPAFAKHHRTNPESLAEKVHLARRTVLLAAVFVVLAMMLLAPLFFQAFYQSVYHDAGWMVQLICFSIWFTCLTGMSSRALLARGVTWVFAASNAVNAVATCVGCVIGFYTLGIPGFILGYGFGTMCGYLVVQYAMIRGQMSMWSQDVKFTALLMVLAAFGYAGQSAVAGMSEGYVSLAMQLGVATLVLGVYALWAGHLISKTLFGFSLWDKIRDAKHAPAIRPKNEY